MTDAEPPLSVNPDGIPELLQERDSWICWREEERDGDDKPTKVPVDPHTGDYGSSTDADTWGTFDEALTAHRRDDFATAGVGFVFPKDDVLTGVDLDNVRDPETAALEPWAAEVVDELDSWTEISVSGTGLHVYALATKPGDACRNGQESTLERFDESELEMYSDSRFFVVTGHTLEGAPESVKRRNDVVSEIYDEYLAPDEADEDGSEAPARTASTDLNDEQLLEKARNAENGDKFDRLWRGDTSGYESHSEADLALCSLLAFWTGGDERQIDALFRQSGLMRAKWDEDRGGQTYGELTIEEAVSGRAEFYEPGAGEPTEPTAAEELERTAEADGGVAADAGSDAGPDAEPETARDRARRRVRDEVLTPFDPPDDYEGEEIDTRTAVDRVANIYHDEFNWVRPRADTRGWRATLYNYVPEEGIYEPHGEAEIERMIDAHLGPVADNQFVNEVVGKVERKARIRAKRLDEPPERLVVSNGILDVTTGELHEHTPAEFHRTRLDVEYDPDADCEVIDEFVHDVVRDKDVPKLYRFIAHALYRGYPEAKAAMLLGEGENGKTTFLNLVESFLGEFNVSHESLKKLNEHEWSPARLNGKLANINADMSDQSPDSMGMFKKLTGEDPIHGEVKFEKPVKFTNHATMLFACNEMPVLHDDTRGNWRRWQLIQFPYVFDSSDPDVKDAVPKDDLEDRLFTEEQFAGLLARCVEEISAWDDGRAFFPDADSWETTRDKMRRAAEPVYDFAHVCLRAVDDDTATLPKETVRDAYNRYATQQGLKKFSPEEFGRRLHGLTDFNIENGRIRDGERRVKVYKGVEFTARGKQILEDEPDPDEASQVGLHKSVPDDASGTSADLDRVRETLRSEGGELPRGEFLAEFCQRYDVDPDHAEHALDAAREHGVIEAPADEVVRLID